MLALERGEELIQRQSINDVAFLQPPFARHTGAQAQIAGLLVAVRVAIDDAFDASALGIRPEPPIHIETVGAGVELDPCAGCRGGIQNRRNIDLVSVTSQKQPPGRMAENRDERILHRADNACS